MFYEVVLTPKHVDVKELMKHVKFEPYRGLILLLGKATEPERVVYPTPAPDFELSRLNIEKGKSASLVSRSIEISFFFPEQPKFQEQKEQSSKEIKGRPG
ncbi:MAG: hypothetical protein WDM78_03665 [Puia sp.]